MLDRVVIAKSSTNNKKQHTSLKLLLKVSNKVTEEIQNFCKQLNIFIKHLNDSIGVHYLFDIASLHLSLFTSSASIQNSDKFDLRTTRINFVLI